MISSIDGEKHFTIFNTHSCLKNKPRLSKLETEKNFLNPIEEIHQKSIANTIFNNLKLTCFLLKLEKSQEGPLGISILQELLVNVIKQEIKTKSM